MRSLAVPLLLISAALLSACASTPSTEQPTAGNDSPSSSAATVNANLAQLQQQASRGDLESQFQLGNQYFNAQPKKDLKQAEYWWKQAADKGHAMSAVSLAYLYTGRNDQTLSNPAQMLKYLNQSAAGGNPMAQHILGTLYQRGDQGVTQDPGQARRLFQSACQQNYEPSCKALGN
ncbi:tetratricopeptide repeat protein [Ectopseudomonas mendocina]|uniref:Tetratricopeptide repeat protein n=1 Tax=Ectopseudomonas mendocina TaxID=300 RepID=A0ABZ2RCY5_ECTME